MRGLNIVRDCIAILVFLLLEPLHAPQQANGTLGALDEADQNFLSSAAEDSQTEIELCLVAKKRATNLALKAFARLMVDDHVDIERRLRVGSERSAIKADPTLRR